jgi:hypothetical protein
LGVGRDRSRTLALDLDSDFELSIEIFAAQSLLVIAERHHDAELIFGGSLFGMVSCSSPAPARRCDVYE